jgi:hypothetical protein
MQTLGEMIGAVAHDVECKVCQGRATLYGVTDFNKSCEEHRGKYLSLSGVAIYYHRCDSCGLIFTTAFDRWDKADFLRHIYNDAYELVDPDYVDVRPANNAEFILTFIKKGEALACVDYGGGNGKLAGLLRERGVDARSWDPMGDDGAIPASGAFDFVSAFEVLEHTPSPLQSIEEALGLLGERGVMLFSTLTTDHLPPRAMDNWYIAPRNGHITLYTKRSLKTLFERYGYRLHHFSEGVHMALREAPSWL